MGHKLRALLRLAWSRTFITVLVVVVPASLGFLNARRQNLAATEPEPLTGGLSAAPGDLDFGDVWEQDEFPWRLHLRNTSGAAIAVADVVLSCDAQRIEPRSFVVAPGAEIVVELRLDLAAKCASSAGLPARMAAVRVMPRLQGDDHMLPGWVVSGKVRKPIEFSEPSIHFGEIVRGDTASARIVRATSAFPLKELRADCDAEQGRATKERISEDGRTWELRIVPAAALPQGPFEFVVAVRGTKQDGTWLSEALLPVRGVMRESVTASPDSVHFGLCEVGSEARAWVTLRGTKGPRQFTIGPTESQVAGLCVTERPGGQADERLFELIQHVEGPGYREGRLRFEVKDPARPEPFAISCSVSYHGIAKAERAPTD